MQERDIKRSSNPIYWLRQWYLDKYYIQPYLREMAHKELEAELFIFNTNMELVPRFSEKALENWNKLCGYFAEIYTKRGNNPKAEFFNQKKYCPVNGFGNTPREVNPKENRRVVQCEGNVVNNLNNERVPKMKQNFDINEKIDIIPHKVTNINDLFRGKGEKVNKSRQSFKTNPVPTYTSNNDKLFQERDQFMPRSNFYKAIKAEVERLEREITSTKFMYQNHVEKVKKDLEEIKEILKDTVSESCAFDNNLHGAVLKLVFERKYTFFTSINYHIFEDILKNKVKNEDCSSTIAPVSILQNISEKKNEILQEKNNTITDLENVINLRKKDFIEHIRCEVVKEVSIQYEQGNKDSIIKMQKYEDKIDWLNKEVISSNNKSKEFQNKIVELNGTINVLNNKIDSQDERMKSQDERMKSQDERIDRLSRFIESKKDRKSNKVEKAKMPSVANSTSSIFPKSKENDDKGDTSYKYGSFDSI